MLVQNADALDSIKDLGTSILIDTSHFFHTAGHLASLAQGFVLEDNCDDVWAPLLQMCADWRYRVPSLKIIPVADSISRPPSKCVAAEKRDRALKAVTESEVLLAAKRRFAECIQSGEQFTATADEVKEFKACVRRNELSRQSLLRCFLEAGMEVLSWRQRRRTDRSLSWLVRHDSMSQPYSLVIQVRSVMLT